MNLKIRVAVAIACASMMITMHAQNAVTTDAGSAGNLPKWTGSTSLGDSSITEQNGNIGIGTVSPGAKLDVAGVINGRNFRIPDAEGTRKWVLLGRYIAPNLGHTIRITAYIHDGFNASNNQDGVYTLLFKTSNGQAVDAHGFAGNGSWYVTGYNSTIAPGQIKWVANNSGVNASSYNLYIYLPMFTYGSHYAVSLDDESSWQNIGTLGVTDPGDASSSVLIPDVGFNILSGNVGIGTNSPTSHLQVSGSSSNEVISVTSSTPDNAYVSTGNSLGSYYSGIAGDHYIVHSTFTGTDVLSIGPAGAVGIGVAPTDSALSVGGVLKLDGTSGSVKFPDGSVQTTAWTGIANMGLGNASPIGISGPYSASGASSPTGAVLNQNYVLNTTGAHNLKIATLPPSSGGSYDHIHLVVMLNPNWISAYNQLIDVIFANREGFKYQYTVRGYPGNANARLTAYQNETGAIDIYLSFPGTAQYTSATYSVLENMQATVYAAPTDTEAPSGTVIFDTSSPSYPPASYLSFDGNLGLGTSAPAARLDVAGNIRLSGAGANITFPDGTVQATAFNGSTCATGGDYAESVDVAGGKQQYEPGDVIAIDPSHPKDFRKADTAYSPFVAGVYSTKPGFTGRRQPQDKPKDGEIPMAMVGIVPTKVTTENGPIHVGDQLVSSSRPGYAMKGTDRSQMGGAVIGKALESLDFGTGSIEVLISLQ